MKKSVNLYSFQCLILKRGRTTLVKVIVEHLTLFKKKMRDPLPFVVLNFLERKNFPCKSDSPTMYLLEKIRDTLPSIMFNSSERKNDSYKIDSRTYNHF